MKLKSNPEGITLYNFHDVIRTSVSCCVRESLSYPPRSLLVTPGGCCCCSIMQIVNNIFFLLFPWVPLQEERGKQSVSQLRHNTQISWDFNQRNGISCSAPKSRTFHSKLDRRRSSARVQLFEARTAIAWSVTFHLSCTFHLEFATVMWETSLGRVGRPPKR